MTNYKVELYRIDVENSEFQPLDVVETFTSLSYVDKLNGVGLARINVDLYNPKANTSNLVPGVTVALIKRDDIAVWVGVVESIRGNAEGASGDNLIQMYSYLHMLSSRYTDLGYFKVDDAGSIASDLVTIAQSKTNGELMIDIGSIATIGDSQETLDYGEIAQALINASDNILSYDFTLTPIMDADNRLDYIKFDVVKRLGSFRDDLPALTNENTDKLNFYIGDSIRNKLVGLGFGTGDNVIEATASNTDSQTTYTLKEDIIKYPSVKSFDYLQNAIDEKIKTAAAQEVELQVRITPNEHINFETVSLGDYLKFNYVIENTLVNFTGSARIISKEVAVDSGGAEYLYLNFNYVR